MLPNKPVRLIHGLYANINATTITLSAPSAGDTAASSATPNTPDTVAMCRAVRGDSSPDGSGRPGCARRSISMSARSFQTLAVMVRHAAPVAASAMSGNGPQPTHQAPNATPDAASTTLGQRIRRRSASTNRALIERFVAGHHLIAREAAPGIRGGGGAHALPACAVTEDVERRGSHAIHVAHLAEHAGDAVAHDLGEAANPRRDHGHAARERLECAQPERLALTRQQEQIGAGQQRRHHVDLAEEVRVVLDAQLARFLFGRRTLWAVAHHDQHRGTLAPNLGEDAHDVADPLHRTEVRHVHDHRAITVAAELFPQ